MQSEKDGARKGGLGQQEVRSMGGMPPTCSTCGSILAGYELNKELGAFVYFCTTCRRAEEEKAARLTVKEERIETREVPKAA